jgi:hypothetical protein
MEKVSFSKRVVDAIQGRDAMQEEDGGDFRQINNRDTTFINDFSFGLDFVQQDGECKHVELSGTEPDKVNSWNKNQ